MLRSGGVGNMLGRPWGVWVLGLMSACSVDKVLFSALPSEPDAGLQDAAVDGAPDAPPPPTFPSCAGLARSCGVMADDDCCRSLEDPGGTYFRSYDLAGDSNSGNQSFPATLGAFRLDRYEVTVGRFRAFVAAGRGIQSSAPAAGAGAHANIADSGWRTTYTANLLASTSALIAALKCNTGTWTDTPGANESRPINCLTWYEALAFCIWDGGYLPTEAEWNHAGTGGDQQRAFPWSSPASSLVVSYDNASYNNGSGCLADGQAACTLEDLLPVGSKPAGDGRWGHADLGGNVSEWVLDSSQAYPVPCTDCAALAENGTKLLRGGAYSRTALDLRPGYRLGTSATGRIAFLGFRCARPAPPR